MGIRTRRRRKRDISANGVKESFKSHAKSKLRKCSLFCVFLVTCMGLLLCFAIFGIAYATSPINAIKMNIKAIDIAGKFGLNEDLSYGIRRPFNAPESFVEDDDKNLYTGLKDGRIVKIYPLNGVVGAGNTEVIASVKFDGKDSTFDIKHGRPLGLRLRNRTLYCIDAVYGVYTVNIDSKVVTRLVKPCDVTPCMRFPDDLDVTADEQLVYFTDVSTQYIFPVMHLNGLEGSCTGRVFRYSQHTKVIETVMRDVCFANGLQLTSDEKTIIVSECIYYRVNWIDVNSGEKKHVLHLPAMPDNVRINRRGTYWVAAASPQKPLTKFLFAWPSLRQVVARLLPSSLTLKVLDRSHCMIFEVNDKGDLLRTLHDPTGNITWGLSEGFELSDGRVALGSFFAPFMGLAELKENRV